MNKEKNDALKRHIVEACVKAANSKGYGDAVGVLRGTLFLEDIPMSMDQLVEETGYSKSTVSSNMSLLENQGAVRRVITPGDKRYHYVPVTDPDSLKKAMMANVRNEIHLIMTALETTEKELNKDDQVSEAILTRINRIRHFYMQSDKLLDLVSRYTTEELIEQLEKGGK